jgi:tetratricopeptide (TPR) repeat protein
MTRADPDRTSQLHRALALLRAGRSAEAAHVCNGVLAAAPGDSAAMTLLAQARLTEGRAAEAVELFSQLTRRAPDVQAHWRNLGTAARDAGDLDAALAAYLHASSLGPSNASSFYNLGLLHLDRGDLDAAAGALERALGLDPNDIEIRMSYADCLHQRLETDSALDVLAGVQLEQLDGDSAARIAQLLVNLGAADRAEQALARAAAAAGLSINSTLKLVQVYERTNRLEPARALLDALPQGIGSLEAERIEIEALLAQRTRQHAAAVRLYRTALADTPERYRRHHLLFPLARSLDALGEFDGAFATLEEAHASQVAALERQAPGTIERGAHAMAITRFRCDPDDVALWDDAEAPDAAASPIFIVGFPRSGTTLLEQAIDAHPALESMDEQPYLQKALDTLFARGVDYPHGLARASRADLDCARQEYMRLARRRVRLDAGQRLVDKNPLNLLRLPLIRRLYPQSRLLLAVRHPCDVLMSCYLQHFRAPDFALLASDLERLATGYARALDFWFDQAALLAPHLRQVRYEQLVVAFEAEMRGIAAFLGLDWHDAMLAPAERARSRRFVSTPSYAQVVEPVSATAVGRSQPYLRHFGPALPHLAPALERWGYVPGARTPRTDIRPGMQSNCGRDGGVG